MMDFDCIYSPINTGGWLPGGAQWQGVAMQTKDSTILWFLVQILPSILPPHDRF